MVNMNALPASYSPPVLCCCLNWATRSHPLFSSIFENIWFLCSTIITVYYSGLFVVVLELFVDMAKDVKLHQASVFMVVIIRAHCLPQTSAVYVFI
jgi:hypothetical protein